jgi:hypothetical protein
VSVLLGTGVPSNPFTEANNFTAPVYGGRIAIADVNRDGKADLVVLNSGGASKVSILLGD